MITILMVLSIFSINIHAMEAEDEHSDKAHYLLNLSDQELKAISIAECDGLFDALYDTDQALAFRIFALELKLNKMSQKKLNSTTIRQ